MQRSPEIAEKSSPAFHPESPAGADARDAAGLFAQLADLYPSERHARLAVLEEQSPARAAELRSLLDAADRAGDFLGILEDRVRGDASPTTGAFTTGQQIGPYRLERLLGCGGAGAVWLASDNRLDRMIALKLFAAPRGSGRRGVAQRLMLHEARAVARLDHPNVAAVHHVGATEDGVAYMAMPWCEGGSLAERLQQGALPVDDALAIAADLASALAAAHAHGVLHRDVKPGNVLFDADGRPRLSDFGIALLSSSAAGQDYSGTLPYMAPEILRGAAPDARSDLWSLGVTIVESVTGISPFRGASRASTIQRILAVDPLAGAEAHPIPPLLAPMLSRLLRANPAERHQSAVDLQRELAHLRTRLRTRFRSYAPPVPLSPLIGRIHLMRAAAGLLERARLLTLTGPGGTGKTRLALELAGRREPLHAAGACFVPLAAIPSADQLPGAVAEALGLRQHGSAEAVDQLRRFCADADLLLVLDNCEHLVDAAEFIRALLAHAPNLRILATSRGPLGVDGEQELPVPPLELPPLEAAAPETIRQTEAVQLFAERASARDPEFHVPDNGLGFVNAICHRLDGLPLAIELAAARVRTLGLEELLSRVEQSTAWLETVRRDRPPRHRTLTSAISWSHELLSEHEQRLFRFLSVCEDGVRAGTAAALLAGADADEAVALLDSLAEKALLVAEPSSDGSRRFGMLSTIRDFARAQLEQAGELAAAEQRRAEWFSAEAIREGAALTGPGQVESLARLREAHHDIVAALAWLIGHGNLEAAAQMAVALHRHWLVRSGSLRETVALLTQLEERLQRAEAELEPAVHARLLTVLGSLTGTVGTHQTVPHRHFEASLALFRAAGDAAGAGKALNHIGWSAHLLGRLEEGARASTEALEIHRQRKDDAGIATSCINLGWIALLRASFTEAERYFSEALAIHQRTGDRRSLAYATGHLATLALARGDSGRALALRTDTGRLLELVGDQLAWPSFQVRYMKCAHEDLKPVSLARLEETLLPELRAAGHGWAVGYALGLLAEVRLADGDVAEAHEAAAESLAVRQRAGVRSGEAECELLLGRIALARHQRQQSAQHLGNSLRARLEMGERLGVVETAEAIGEWLLPVSPAESLALLDACTSLRHELGAGRTPRYGQHVKTVWPLADGSSGGTGAARQEHPVGSLDAVADLAAQQLERYSESGP